MFEPLFLVDLFYLQREGCGTAEDDGRLPPRLQKRTELLFVGAAVVVADGDQKIALLFPKSLQGRFGLGRKEQLFRTAFEELLKDLAHFFIVVENDNGRFEKQCLRNLGRGEPGLHPGHQLAVFRGNIQVVAVELPVPLVKHVVDLHEPVDQPDIKGRLFLRHPVQNVDQLFEGAFDGRQVEIFGKDEGGLEFLDQDFDGLSIPVFVLKKPDMLLHIFRKVIKYRADLFDRNRILCVIHRESPFHPTMRYPIMTCFPH